MVDAATRSHRARAARRRITLGLAMGLTLISPSDILAGSFTAAWTRQFGTTDTDAAGGIAADGAGYVVVGVTNGNLSGQNKGYSDAFIRRYDGSGGIVWTRQFGTQLQDSGDAVAVDAGGYTVLGTTDGVFGGPGGTLGRNDLFVRRYSRAGQVLWTERIGTGKNEVSGGVAADSGGITVVGSTGGNVAAPHRSMDVVVGRYGFDGSVRWTRQFGTARADFGSAVSSDADGITVAGGTDGNLDGHNAGPFTDGFVRRYSRSGLVRWTRQFGQAGDDQVLSVAGDATGISAVGYTRSQPTTDVTGQAFIRRYDHSGTLVWKRIFGTPEEEIAWGVTQDHDALTVTGYTQGSLDGPNQGGYDAFVRRYDRSGSLHWGAQIGTVDAEIAVGVAAGTGGFAVLGHTNGAVHGPNQGDLDIFVRKYSH
jgi:hypothetical protein